MFLKNKKRVQNFCTACVMTFFARLKQNLKKKLGTNETAIIILVCNYNSVESNPTAISSLEIWNNITLKSSSNCNWILFSSIETVDSAHVYKRWNFKNFDNYYFCKTRTSTWNVFFSLSFPYTRMRIFTYLFIVVVVDFFLWFFLKMLLYVLLLSSDSILYFTQI